MKELPPVTTQQKDGDPRKFKVISNLFKDHPDVLPIWHEFDLMERKRGSTPETQVRKHGAPEHMIGGAVNIRALGQLFVERGILGKDDVLEAEEAFLVHDSGKPLEFPMVKAVAEGATWDDIKTRVEGADPTPSKELTKSLESQFASQLNPNPGLDADIDKGRRIHIARAEVAGALHKDRLLNTGVSKEVVDLQGYTEYSSCPDIETVVDNFNTLEGPERTRAIQELMVHWADDGMMESVMKPIEERCRVVFQKPANIPLNQAYRDFNSRGETAEEIQVRVGHKVEEILSDLLGLDNPSQLYATVDQKLQELIVNTA